MWSSGICSPKPTFWVFFPNRIFKGAICAAKSKYEDEWTICRATEVTQDKAESRACQAEESLKALRDECDAVHKSLAFWEAEREELQIELDIERERNRQELRVKGDGSGEQRGSGVHQTVIRNWGSMVPWVGDEGPGGRSGGTPMQPENVCLVYCALSEEHSLIVSYVEVERPTKAWRACFVLEFNPNREETDDEVSKDKVTTSPATDSADIDKLT